MAQAAGTLSPSHRRLVMIADVDKLKNEGAMLNQVKKKRAMTLRFVGRHLMAALISIVPVSVGHAQTTSDFYKGKNVEVYIGYGGGSGYDIYGRLLARHLGKHLPGNPTVIVKNMEGAGSLKLANWLYTSAPKDGTVIGTVGRGVATPPPLASPRAKIGISVRI